MTETETVEVELLEADFDSEEVIVALIEAEVDWVSEAETLTEALVEVLTDEVCVHRQHASANGTSG